MTYILLLDHWSDMTFHLKDVIYLGTILFTIAGAYFTINSNKKRICKLEGKADNLYDILNEFKIEVANLKFELVKEFERMINNNK